jgi:hypothetical protein
MNKNSQILLEVGQGLFMMVGLPVISEWTVSDRPKNAKRGTIGFNIQTNSIEYWDGVHWFGAVMTEK